jgi:hypothetical protein
MAAFFAFLGAALGFWLAFRFAPWPLIAVLSSRSFPYFPAKKRKALVPFFVGMALAFLLGLIHPPVPFGKGNYRGVVIETKSNYFLFQSGFSRYYVYEEGTTREVGDILQIYGNGKAFVRTAYESQFNFSDYLLSKGISSEIDPYKIQRKSCGCP